MLFEETMFVDLAENLTLYIDCFTFGFMDGRHFVCCMYKMNGKYNEAQSVGCLT